MAIDQGQKKTNPSPYDQVIIMSQRFINASFARMWQEAPYNDPLKRFERTGPRTQDMINVTFEPPQIFIPAPDRNYPGQVYLRMKVLRGDIYLYSNSTNAFPDHYDMDGWDLYFKMRIRNKDSDRHDPKYTAYQNLSGFKNAIFDLTQLYMGLSDPSNPNEAFDSRKSTYAASNLTPDAKKNLQTVMADWLRSARLENPRCNLLGYVFRSQQAQTLGGAESSLVPKIIDYNVYPWRGPDGSHGERDGIDENALCILITTGSHQPPYPPGINYSGPFVERGATLCINANCFWEDWILRDIQVVARDTEIIADKPPFSLTNSKWTIGVKYHLGSKASPGSFHFARQVNNGRTSWAWQGKLHKVRSNTVNMELGGGKYFPFVLDETSQSWITIEPNSGDEHTFSIKGRHVFYHALLWKKDVKLSQWVKLIADWHIKFNLQATDDGGVEIAAQLRDRSWLTIQTKKGTIIRTNQGYLRNHAATMEKELRKRLERAVSQISRKLNQAFQVQHKFIMPSSGVFAMRYPKFNNRGDLLVELEYLNFNAPNSKAVDPTQHVVDDSKTEFDHFPFHKIPSVSQDYPSRQPVDHHDHDLTREPLHDDVYHEYHVDEDEFHKDHTYHPDEHDDEHEDHRPDQFKHTERPWHEEGDSPFHSDNEPDNHKNPDKKPDDHTPDDHTSPEDRSRPHRRPQQGRTDHKDYASDDDDYY
ncbi:hypothetical protein ALT_7452 [Aspergillus lentulus]|uniref:Uncharacterized protein n=1 Tax=Aspergillus lentulus TaxID=293939 RepID=A0AAN4TCW4_ASPLE|nr:hypothetical protein ALT_7452 [Aspergillus lentulus]